MEPLVLIATLALLGEVLIEVLKPLLAPLVAWFCDVVQATPEQVYLYISAALGVTLAVLYEADLLLVVGLPSLGGAAVYIGQVATGLIIGRGANAVHDVYSRLSGAGEVLTIATEELTWEPTSYGSETDSISGAS